MANALSLFRSFFTGGLFAQSAKTKKRSFRPNLLILDPRINPASVNLSGATGWTPIMIGATKDYANDSQAGAADTDIIGDATHGSLYTAFDDNNTTSTADDTLVFRMRINNPTSTTNFAGVAIVGMDANQDGRVDIFMSVDGRNNGQAIRIFDPGTGLNNTPNTTTTNPLTVGILPNNGVYSFNANNYSVDPVSATSDPNWNGQTDGLNGVNFGSNDAFISWRLPIADLATVLAKPSPVDRSGMYGPRGSTGIPGFTKDTVVQYINFTQTQTGPINGDMNGLPRNYDGSATFSSLGAFTTLMSSANPVPAATVLYINEPIGDGNISASESTSVTISGTTNAPAGSTVQLTITDSSSGTVDVTATANVILGLNGVNTWSVSNVNVSNQVDGNLTVTASVIVNSITSTDTATVSLDKTIPAITISTLPVAISGKPTFTGTTDLPAGSTLTITIDPDNDPATANNIVYTTLVQSGGTWSLDTSLQSPISGTMPSGGLVSFSNVTVSGTDAAGNTATATLLNRPTVNTLSTNDTTPLIGGTWTNISGDVLSVTVNGVSYTPTISVNTWTVQVSNALTGGSSYQVVATVTRGASSVTDTTTGELTITTTPVVTIAITGGSSSTTSNTLPTISGTSTNYNSSAVIVRIDPNNDGNMADTVTYSVTTDSSGNWSLNTGNNANLISGSIPLSGYSGTIHVYAENISGTATAEQSLTIITPTVVISTIISGATTNSFATVNNTSTAANYLNMTEDDSVTVTGTAPNGYTVDLVIRDPNGNFVSQNGIAVSSGTWSVSGLNLSNLDDGVLNITATLSGTTTTTTNTAVTHDKTAPIIYITAQNPLKKTDAVITGRTDLPSGTNLTVEIYDGATLKARWTVNSDSIGYFTTSGVSPTTGSANIGNAGTFTVKVFPTTTTTDLALNITQLTSDTRSGAPNASSNTILIGTIAGDNQISVNEITSGLILSGTTTLTTAATSAFTVTVSDGTTTITVPTASITNTSGNWTATLTATQVKSLKNGQLTVNASINDAGTLVYDAAFPSLNLPSPILSITDNVPGTVIGSGTVTFTFTFTEGVTGFDATDVVVTNGTKGTFSSISASSYTLVVTPTANSSGAINVSVASGVAVGVNTGRGNTPASASQNFNTTTAASVPTITINIDSLATNSLPIISGTTSLAAGAPVIISIDPDNDNSTNNNITYSATVQSGGTWSVNIATETPDTGVVPFEGLPKYANITATAINAFGISATVTGLNKPTVNTLITNTTTPTVTGTWANIAGDTLTVTVNGLSYTPTINGNTWSVAVINSLANGASYEVVATVTRTSTSTSKVDISSNEVTIDTQPPTVAITSITTDTGNAGDFKTNDTTLVYTGTAETNSTVFIILRDSQSNVVFSSSVIASGGNWSLDRTGFALPDGTYTLNATAMDAAGNSSTAIQTVKVDLTGPTIAITSGRSTNSSTPVITGTTDLPVGSTITVKVDPDNDNNYANATTYTTTVQAGGLWSVQATTVITGTVGVMASGTDEVGNTTTATQPLTLNLNIPVIIITEPLDTNGNSNAILDAVEDNSVVISGNSANIPNGGSITVTITDGTTSITDTAIVSANSWSLSALNLSSLANGTIFVTADYIDGSGNFYSDTASILHDKTAGGAISIDSISQDTGVIADFITNDQTLVFTGSTTGLASVTVVIKNSSNTTVQTFSGIAANSSGTWSTPTSNTLIDGNYTIEATTGSITATQAFTIDLTAPSVPTVQSSTTTSNTPIITGTVSLAAGDVLRVTVDGITYTVGTNLTVNSGTWSLQIPGANALQGGTYSVTATVTDVARNISTDTTNNELIVNTVNPDPVVTTSSGTTPFIEANNTTSTSVVVDSGVTVSDPDSLTLASATVTISGGYQPDQDILGFLYDGNTMGNISGSYSSGILLLTSSGSTATIAQWQAALKAVTYTNSSNTPNTSTRTISFVVNDGTNNSNTATKSISVTTTNDAPIVSTSGGTTAFTEGNNTTSTPVVIDSGLTVSDADSSTLASAIVSITSNFQASEDLLGLVLNSSTMGNITASYNSSTGVLTLTSSSATSTVAQWQAALQAVTYTNSSDTPNTSTRTISFVVNDGSTNSNTATKDVSVTTTNDAPIIANAIPNQNATEDISFSFQFAANTFADVDVGDTLTYSVQLNGGGALPAWLSFDPLTRTFSGTPSNSDVGTISIDVTANDGNGGTVSDTFNIVVANVNDAPTVANPIPNRNATEDISFSFQFAANTFSDVDVGDTITYSAQLNGGGALPAWLSFDPLTRTFSGTPSNSDVGTISIDVTANDGNGGTVSDTFNIIVANIPDVINVTSSTSNGYYKAGDAITILVQFDESVTINTAVGTPYLVLETGTTDRNAVYTSGSGTLTLTFTYTVQPGDTTADLDYVSSSSLVLNGGTVQNIATRDATLTLANPGAIGSLGANKTIVIDTTPPSIGLIDIDSLTDTGVDDTITNHGNPVITLTGETGLTISLLGADGTTLLTPVSQYTVVETSNGNGTSTYTVTLLDANGNPNDGNQPFGTYLTTSPNIGTHTNNGGSVADGLYTIKATDLAGNQATVGTFTIDTTPPGTNPNPFGPIDIYSVTDTGANDTVTSHGNPIITFTGEAGLTITLFGSNNQLLNSSQYTVTYSAGTYTVTLIDANITTSGNQPFGTYSGSNPTGNAANEADGLYTIKATDLAGNQATVGTFTIDTTPPGVPTVGLVTDTGLSGTDKVTRTSGLVVGGVETGAVVEYSTTGTNGWTTTAPAPTEGSNSVYVRQTDLAGNVGDASLVYTYTYDTMVPSVTITSSVVSLNLGAATVLTITFSEIPVGFSLGDFTVTSGSVSSLMSTNDPKVFTANYTAPNTSVGTETISITNASYTDQAGNNGNGFSFNQQITNVVPTLTITADKSNLEFGQTAKLTFTFSEPPIGFTVNDISASNGILGSLIVDPNNPNVYTVIFTPAKEFIGNSIISVTNGAYTNSTNTPGLGASISPSLSIFTKIRGFVATGDDSEKAGRRLNETNNMSGTSVVLYDPTTGEASGSTIPFNNFQGQVRIARADTNNDGILEMVVSTGPGGTPQVKIIDSTTGNTLGEFMAYDPNFKGGVFVSIVDINNDGFSEIITGAGESGGPHVKVFNSGTKSEIFSFFAYDKNFSGGVSVAAYDVDLDGILDIVTGAGPGGGPHVKVFSGRDMHVIKEFMAYDPNFRGGVFVSVGDFMSDGSLEIITGPGIGGGPHLKVWDYSTLNLIAEKMVYDKFITPDGQIIDALFAGGVRVGLADGNDDGILDAIVGAGPGGGPHVKVLAGFNLEEILNFFSGEKTDQRGVFISQ